MATKICPKCGVEREARGFEFHVKACKGTLETLSKRYATQTVNMTPHVARRFLRKAGGKL